MQQSEGDIFVVLFVFRIESESTFSFNFLKSDQTKDNTFLSTNLLAILKTTPN